MTRSFANDPAGDTKSGAVRATGRADRQGTGETHRARRRGLGTRFLVPGACGLLAIAAASTPASLAEAAAPAPHPSSASAPAPHAATGSPVSSANLLTGNQASFATSIGGWVGASATLSWVSSVGDAAPGALEMSATGSAGMGAISGSPTAGGVVPASAGTVYAGGVAAQSVSSAQQVETVIAFYGSTGSLVDAVFGPDTQAALGAWTQATAVSALAPAKTTSVALYVLVPTTTTGDQVYLDDAWLEGASDQSPSVAGPLHTAGNQIVDSSGHQVTFHGMVLDGLEGSSTATQITYQTVLGAKAWGANFLRVPLGEQFWLGSNCDYDPNYAARVTQVVNWITSLGMVALLDLHTNTVGGCATGVQHNMADEAQSPAFWSQVASTFGSNRLVAFDLYNEPHNISDSVWLNGGTTTDLYGGQTYQAAGMQQLYNSVRATGAQNLIFISGNSWANTVPSNLVNGNNIVYAAHVYTCPGSPPPSCTNSNPYDPSGILDNWVGISASVPVMVTEFGWPSQYDGTYNGNVIAFASSHGWGWSAFDWEEFQYAHAFDLTDAWLNDGTPEPAPSGMPVLCALADSASGTTICSPPATN
ncbi:MAG TPA: glycoside hydrolase family 5 protein [Acidimicrobiales bacterium]|nr:glycoside hydrolase family 5 protein [Acidimicrobiales bacterium]